MEKQKIKHLPLWQEFKSTENENKKHKLRNKLVEEYYPLVGKIAFKLAKKLNWKVRPEELTSFGVDGLYIAINKFDYDRGVKFENYASMRIHGSMVDNMRKEDIIPRSVRINHNVFEKTRMRLESERGCLVSDYDVAEELGISVSDYSKNIKKYHPLLFSSIEGSDMGNTDNEEVFKKDFNSNLIDRKCATPDCKLIRKEFFSKLLGKGFTSVERMIVYLYYYKNLTMDKIAERLDLSESRVSQIHKNLLPRMKSKIFRNPEYFATSVEEFIIDCNDTTNLF